MVGERHLVLSLGDVLRQVPAIRFDQCLEGMMGHVGLDMEMLLKSRRGCSV